MRAIYLPLMVIFPLVAGGYFSEPDRASTHTLERPPNLQDLKSPAYVYHVILPAPFPEERAEYLETNATDAASLEAQIESETPPMKLEPTAMPTPLYVAPKLSHAIDAEMRRWLEEAGAPEEYIEPMIAIGTCESRGSPEAIGDGGNSRGWLQLWTGWFPDAGYSLDQWSDPVVNAAVGVHVREVRGRFGGVGGWSCADHLGIY